MSIEKIEKNKCCGCLKCINECPKQCIELIQDEEGYYYPNINKEKCINCNICLKNCPNNFDKTREKNASKIYVLSAVDDNIKKISSSGGVFYYLAKYVLEENKGVVYGATFDKNFNVKHEKVTQIDDLDKILRSKYVQSNMLEAYSMIEEDIKDNKVILFCGTPCQVKSIYSKYKYYDKLILVDFICHGVPSPGIWDSYKNYVKNDSKIEKINFRSKNNGWHDYKLEIKMDNKKINESHDINTYMRTFLSDKNIRPSCFNCSIKPDNYFSDITLGDAWKIEKDNSDFDDDKGTSIIALRTNRGIDIFEKIKYNFKYYESQYDKWCQYNPSLVKSTIPNDNRNEFFNDYKCLSNNEFWRKNSKIPFKKNIKYKVKVLLKKFKLEQLIRKFF